MKKYHLTSFELFQSKSKSVQPHQNTNSQKRQRKQSLSSNFQSNNVLQSITTCASIDNPTKFSLKTLRNSLEVQSHLYRRSINLNIKYEDIRSSQRVTNNIPFLSNLFCGSLETIELGCKCQVKCFWIKKWLTTLTQMPFRETYHQKLPSKIKVSHHNRCPTSRKFPSLKNQVLAQIEKDLSRTQPNSQTFQSPLYLNRLKQTLISYISLDEEIGYVQGMNMIASVLVYHSTNTYESAKMMELLMIKCQLRQIFKNDLLVAQKHAKRIVWLLQKKCNTLYRNIVNKHEINLEIFIIGWILSLLASIVPLKFMHLVVNAYIEERWKGIYAIILTLLVYLKSTLQQISQSTSILQFLSFQNLCSISINWEQIILSSYNFPINQKQI